MRTAFLSVALLMTAEALPAQSGADLNNADVLVKLYPPRALKAGEAGPVGFKVSLDKAGHPTACEVTQTSGFPRLDEETCVVVTQHAVFAANPGVGSGSSTHQGVINWVPRAGYTAAAKPANAVAKKDKLICKRTPRTGSNAQFDRVCMTKQQWAEQSGESKAPWEELQGRGWKQGT